MTALHADIQDRLIAILSLLREVKEMAHDLPTQHVDTRKIHVELQSAIDKIKTHTIHAVWVHSKQHRRASGE
ncbi:MAG: hypothetical protein ACW99G_23285 [Candidatus Thorarchaeota archaeon]|jgi:hypothetical protein